jgi:DNA modification methylase
LDPRTLKPNPKNTGVHPEEQRAAIRDSLKKYGWVLPPVWNRRTGRLIDGHARIEEAVSQEWPLVPVRVMDVSAEDELRILATLQRTTELREVDNAVLAELLETFSASPEGLPTGYDEEDLRAVLEAAGRGAFIPIGTPEDDLPPPPEPPVPETAPARVERGELWELGGHRLFCGSSTSGEAVAAVLAGSDVDLLFTDPPYGVSSKWGTGKMGKVPGKSWMVNDELTDQKLLAFLIDAFQLIPLRSGRSAYVCMQHTAGHWFGAAFTALGWRWRHSICWNKNNIGLGSKGYRHKWEQIAFLTHGDDYEWMGDQSQADVWDIPRPTGDDKPEGHPTPKPVALVARAIKNSSLAGEVVFDGFAGVGATLLACEGTNRLARVIELRPDYCDIILKRWEDATGKEAVKL